MKNIHKFVLLLSLVIVSLSQVATADSFLINFPKDAEGWVVLFPAAVNKNAFVDAATAIQLESVTCDGVKIEPEYILKPGGANRQVIAINQKRTIYRFDYMFLECWVDINAQKIQVGEVKRYTIPHRASSVRITYRVRNPDGALSEVEEVVFVASDRQTQFLVTPKDVKVK